MGGDLEASKVPGAENPADLMTKHVAAAEITKHTSSLNFYVDDSRAVTAPNLHAVNWQGKEIIKRITAEDDDNDELDTWTTEPGRHVRVHCRPRRTLFTPRRVAGAPARKDISTVRVTKGEDLDTGERFEIVDNWTRRPSAHACTGRRWTGTTTFMTMSHSCGITSEKSAIASARLALCQQRAGRSQFCHSGHFRGSRLGNSYDHASVHGRGGVWEFRSPRPYIPITYSANPPMKVGRSNFCVCADILTRV